MEWDAGAEEGDENKSYRKRAEEGGSGRAMEQAGLHKG